ncbi:AMP-binding protein [Metabacillus sediminilitoris]|uniref:Acyl-CoA synthetase n=1 Tax=Metabacillus sediminilitoris TaxID=2567941 RepID=A0A4S4BPH7_9BACI|nr:AMP-binding protein [Metabacillus sediminilitoris]QGQ47663.1 AMP-binding protein [Metabacillus sediminilitoris]THF76772.1 acyl-CoA synthetase [Metabacillus sediminilitoris]
MKITSTYKSFAERADNRIAIVTDDERVTYGDWLNLVQRTAASFYKETVINKRVALFLPNGRLFLQLFAGASEAGWASIVGDMRWKEREIVERLQQVTPDLIIADEKMKEFFHQHPIKTIFSDEIEEWLGSNIDIQDKDENVPFYIGFTSGSTGQPKAFIRSHHSWIESFRCNQVDLEMTEKEHVLIPGSFVNSTFLYGALSTLFLGGTIYVLKKFSPARLMNSLRTYPISTVYVVPTMIQGLLNAGYFHEQSVSFISTGAKWLPSVKSKMRQQFPNATFYEFYGSSELSYVSVLKNDEQVSYADSVGRVFHNVEISIRNEKGREVKVGEDGILYVKSKMLFDGYLNNEQETKKVLQGEWATVYDIAKIDEKGYIYLLGRQNDMILYGGMNIYPQEIEQVLKRYEGVDEAVVLGIDDEYWGEKVAAFINGNVSLPLLKSYCLKTLSSYKIPQIWRKVDTFPYTTGGKISRQEIKKLFEKGALK